MSLNQQLLVLKRLEDWLLLLQPCLRKLPKSMRFTLGQRLEGTSLECIDLVIRANLDKPRRPEHVLQARVAAERLQTLVRLSNAQGVVDLKHYELYSERLTEISKMLAGWARASKT